MATRKILTLPDQKKVGAHYYMLELQKDRLEVMAEEHNHKSTGDFIVALMNFYDENKQ